MGPAEYFELSSDDGRPTGGERPAALSEPWPQGKMERHDGIAYELVQALDAPVLQTVEQLPNVVQFLATQLPVIAEPVIEVPKILPHDIPPRRFCREPQLVEQLVEVPTVVSWSMLQRTMEQNVDIPAVGGCGTGGGLSGFLPGQYSLTAEQIVDNPVPSWRFRGDFQGLHRGQSSTAFFEQIADPGGGPQNFLSVQGPAVSSSISPEHAGSLGFRTFSSSEKSAEVAGQEDEKSTPAAYEVRHAARDDLWVQIMTDDEPYFWHRVEQTSVWRMPPGTRPAWVRTRDGLFFHIETETVQHSLSGTF